MNLKALLNQIRAAKAGLIAQVEAVFAPLEEQVVEAFSAKKIKDEAAESAALIQGLRIWTPKEEKKFLINLSVIDLLPCLHEVPIGKARLHLLRVLCVLELSETRTVGQLMMTSESELLRYRGFGKETLKFLNACLKANGLCVGGMSFMDVSAMTMPKLEQGIEELLAGMSKARRDRIVQSFANGIDISVPYSPRSRVTIKVKNVADLLVRTEITLLKFDGITTSDIRYIKKAIKPFGLAFEPKAK